MDAEKRQKVVSEFAHVINCNSLENASGTPDFILAEFLVACLESYNNNVAARDKWRGFTTSLSQDLCAASGPNNSDIVHG